MSKLNDQLIEASLREAFQDGAPCLVIYSKRQDIGIQKCEWGVAHGYLTFQENVIGDQETHWQYNWTSKARRKWPVPQ